jgi:pimeloyl-ACP methyl ester carboxylesterase
MKISRPYSKLFLLILLLVTGRAARAQDAKPDDSSPGKPRAASSQRISTAAAAAVRTSPFDPPEASDISFSTDAGPGLDTGCTFRSGGPLVYRVEIKRFIGELNPDGTLKDAAALVAAGLLSPKLKLVMPGFDIDSGPPPPDVAPEIDRVSFNGQPLGVLSGHNNQWVLNSFEIPIEKVKFAERGAGGGEPVGGVNEIRIDIDTGNVIEAWCTSIDWGSVSFKAASPIILVHGNGSDGGFFDRMEFTSALKAQRLVYDNSISMETKKRNENARDLNTLIPKIAKELGARNVHIVTHSKGGLDVREYLAKYQRDHQKCFKVLSLTTLSGPHDGSIGANVRVERARAAADVGHLGIEFVGFPEWTNELALMMGVDPATPDLTTGAAVLFNPRNIPRLLGLGVTYNTAGADADQNKNRQIDSDEFFWLRLESPALFVIDLQSSRVAREMVDAMYQIVRHTPSLSVTYREGVFGRKVATISNIYPTPNRLNDVMVATDSAHGLGGFHNLVTDSITFEGNKGRDVGRDHASVAHGETAKSAVIPWILKVERSKGGLR